MSDQITKKDIQVIVGKTTDNLTTFSLYAQEMAAMDHKINRLERYIQVLADKAGVDLDKI